MLKKGDTCYVRLMSGKVVKAAYDEYTGDLQHFVTLPDGRYAMAQPELLIWDSDQSLIPDCRFVVMSGMRKEYVDSINN